MDYQIFMEVLLHGFTCKRSGMNFNSFLTKSLIVIKLMYSSDLYKYILNIRLLNKYVGRDSSVGIATRYGLDGPGIESRRGARFSVHVQTGPVAYPASYAIGTGSFTGVKRPGRGVDHPPH
jgi:hypothetical protein